MGSRGFVHIIKSLWPPDHPLSRPMNQGIRHEFDIPRNYGFIEIGQRLLAKVVFTDGQSNRQTDRQTDRTDNNGSSSSSVYCTENKNKTI